MRFSGIASALLIASSVCTLGQDSPVPDPVRNAVPYTAPDYSSVSLQAVPIEKIDPKLRERSILDRSLIPTGWMGAVQM
jgi:hypothetical protein